MIKPKERAESIGMSPAFTLVLGVVEVLGALSLIVGVYPQIGAIALIGVMLGAIQKKMFVWKTGWPLRKARQPNIRTDPASSSLAPEGQDAIHCV
ncbi:MAG TPA: DoxX family protein [Thermoanaerobaculia bacterium]|nr:DoxX family protein [Thermoanaerobaculia bacterium]